MSNYAEPKVTIDLSEYNELQELKKITSDETVIMAKSVVAALLNSRNNEKECMDVLNKQGIAFWITGSHTRYGLEPSDVNFKRLDK